MMRSLPVRNAGRGVDCQECALRKACALYRLQSEEHGVIGPPVRERVFRRGDVLLEEGEAAVFLRVVKMGTAFGYRRGVDGRSRPIGIVSRGGALGVFALFDMPGQATCVAITPVRVCEIPVAALRHAGACSPTQVAQVTRSVVETFAALSAWSEAMRLPGVVEQLAYVLVLLADASRAPVVELPSQAALAELLGTRRETIARALRALEQEGGLRRHERRRCQVSRHQLLARVTRADR